MEMGTRKNLLVFGIVSVIVHAITAMSIGSFFINDNQILITAADAYKPLIVAMETQGNSIQPDKSRTKHQAISSKKPASPFRRNTLSVKRDSAVELSNSHSLVSQNTQLTLSVTKGSKYQDLKIANLEVDPARDSRSDSSSHKNKIRESIDINNLEQKNAVIHKRLNAVVESNFHYPRFAVKRGWEGTVELGLRIEANGRLSNVHVVKTSGYSILDEAALSTLSQANILSGLDAWLAGNYFDTTLPVKYKLVGG